ncbi:MAG: hypothetical protein IPJ30_11130 [Acidobacteria bacterium]|nr:hypothetical protein [Acidobacteriota bacterium]
MSYALELEKSLKSVADAIESATDGDARKHLRAAGDTEARTRFARITARRVLFFVFSPRIC